MRKTRIPAGTGTVFHGYENSKPVPVPVCTRDMILTVLPVPVTYLIFGGVVGRWVAISVVGVG